MCFIDFRERKGKEREKHRSVAFRMYAPRLGIIVQPFGVRDDTPAKPPGQGWSI